MNVPSLSAPPRINLSAPARSGPFVPRTTMSWQTMLADLSLILFMVSAAAIGEDQTPPSAAPAPRAKVSAPPQGEPLALWRDGGGAPPLGQWLAMQQADARQQLTLTLRYPPRGQAEALARAADALRSAGAAGSRARVVLEPVADTAGIEVIGTLAFDREQADRENSGK